jgi:hypothetical protein
MRVLLRSIAAFAAVFMLFAGPVRAAEADVFVLVPEVPGGVIVSNCYRAVGRVHGATRFEFCLRQRGTYVAVGSGFRCEGRLDWSVSGVYVNIQLRAVSCGGGVAWSPDTIRCRPNLLLGFIAGLLGQDRPLLDRLSCTYRPSSGASSTTFVARRI